MNNIDNTSVGASAQASNDGKRLVVRITNVGDAGAAITLDVPSFSGVVTPTTWLLQAPVTTGSNWYPSKGADNPFYDPTRISPKRDADGVLLDTHTGTVDKLALPPFSYLVVEYARP